MLTYVSRYHTRGRAVGLNLITGVMRLNFLVVTLTITLWLQQGVTLLVWSEVTIV